MYTVPWKEIISLGVVPLVKWIIEQAAKRKAQREEEEREDAEQAEKDRLKANRLKAIKDAKENFDDIDPSKIEV